MSATHKRLEEVLVRARRGVLHTETCHNHAAAFALLQGPERADFYRLCVCDYAERLDAAYIVAVEAEIKALRGPAMVEALHAEEGLRRRIVQLEEELASVYHRVAA